MSKNIIEAKFEHLLENFTFIDGSPCGIIID